MNFEDAYKKLQDGTASEEEKAFVTQEIEKLRKISFILDNPAQSEIFSEASDISIQKARKRFNCRTTLRVISITLVSLLVIAALVCGIIFIPSCTSAAKNQHLNRDECYSIAVDYLTEMLSQDASAFAIHDIDKELRIPNGLTNAIYVYEIELRSHDGIEYELEVSTKSGYCMLTDIDRHH